MSIENWHFSGLSLFREQVPSEVVKSGSSGGPSEGPPEDPKLRMRVEKWHLLGGFLFYGSRCSPEARRSAATR